METSILQEDPPMFKLMPFPELIDQIKVVCPEVKRDENGVEDVAFLRDIDSQYTPQHSMRVKLIACGFAWQMSEEQIQALLKKNRQAPLYSRNLWEFVLKYAFRHGMSYEEWRALHQTVMAGMSKTNGMAWEDVLSGTIEGHQGEEKALFRKGITLPAIESYIEQHGGNVVSETRALTEEVERALRMAELRRDEEQSDAEVLGSVIRENLERFSVPRAKARLYFLREVSHYMDWVVTNILELHEQGEKETVLDMAGHYFGCKTNLKKKEAEKEKPLSAKELRTYLREKNLLPSAIAKDVISFFGRPLLMKVEEYLEEALKEEWYSDEEEEILVCRLGLRSEAEEGVSADELLRAYIERAENDMDRKSRPRYTKKEAEEKKKPEEASYGESFHIRRYETCMRNMIVGEMEVSREWLLLMMLFVEKTTNQTGVRRLRLDRVNNVLQKCSFDTLDSTRREIDAFLMEAIQKELTCESMGSWMKSVALMELLQEDGALLAGMRVKKKTLQHDIEALDPEQAKREKKRREQVADKIKKNPWKTDPDKKQEDETDKN